MKFKPAPGYIEVEPIQNKSIILSEKFSETAKYIQGDDSRKPGDIIAFRKHGFFEIEYENQKHYVIRNHDEFILGTYYE